LQSDSLSPSAPHLATTAPSLSVCRLSFVSSWWRDKTPHRARACTTSQKFPFPLYGYQNSQARRKRSRTFKEKKGHQVEAEARRNDAPGERGALIHQQRKIHWAYLVSFPVCSLLSETMEALACFTSHSCFVRERVSCVLFSMYVSRLILFVFLFCSSPFCLFLLYWIGKMDGIGDTRGTD
jgi:hypothetical protein